LFFYTAYGYTFKSDIDLPGFCQLQRNTDHPIISINRKAPWSPAFPLTTAVTSIRVTDGITIHWRGVASYDIRRGRSITIAPSLAPGPLSKLEIQPLYGIAMASILHQNKLLVLHGSTVAINGKGIVIIGHKGYGKSTLTACLFAKGHDFICDDVTAFSVNKNGETKIRPGIPRIKLWPDAVKTIGLDPSDLPLLSPRIPKHMLYISDKQFKNKDVPLQTIVMLDQGDSIALHEMNESDKMIWLLGGHYLAKHHHTFQSLEQKRLFKHCSQLARETRIIRINSPRNSTSPLLIAKLIEEYCS